MFRMEINSSSSSESSSSESSPEPDAPILSPKDRILKRLALIDVSEESLEHMQLGIIAYVKRNSSRLQEICNAILPTDDEILTAIKAQADPGVGDLLQESMVWLQWLMFDGDPVDMLQRLAVMNVDQRGVCGSVWGNDEMAYRCRTCEVDPTCAICVPCFVNGDHKDHDYSVIKTGGGSCDCGDVTGWKRSGFCSKHKGSEQMQPLQEDVAKTLGPVLDYLFLHWKNSLLRAEGNHQNSLLLVRYHNASKSKRVADVLTSVVVGMLLEFCKCSESLLSFVSGRLCYTVNLLDVLVKAERFLSLDVVSKLHKLLLKLLSDPSFKNEFAKAFVMYYPTVVNEVLQQSTDAIFRKLPLLLSFGFQIFTVPTVTPRLVKDMDLLTMLLECLSKIFSSCSGQDHRLKVSEWQYMYQTTQCVVKHIEFVMSNSTIPKYMTCERRDISRTWMQLLLFLQGMNPEKREIHIHVEQENGNFDFPFQLMHYIAKVHALLVAGAFTTEEESISIAKVNEKDVKEKDSFYSLTSLDCEMKAVEGNADRVSVLTSASSLLIFECLWAIEYWLKANSTSRTSLERQKTVSSGLGGQVVEGEHTHELEVLSSADWPEIEYDVSTQEISVHIPLHRLLSLILQRALKRCYGESESSTDSSIKYGDFFGHVLGGCHLYGFSAFVMEHPLRIRVFCSEVQAGMWRRNGDAAILSCEWYRSASWSEQRLELDLFLLQCCAALAPADLYIARIIERFGLSSYLSLNMERANEYEPVLMRDMLILIIQILKERRYCGLTTTQCLQRELIYNLSSRDATHSELVNSLPHELSKVNQLQQVLDNVAEYSYPSGTKQGMYQLRLEYWKELDLYHPRWISRDLQAAEERYLHFCKASASANQLPKWSKIYPPLNGLAKVATCKTVLQIIRAVLFYALFTDTLVDSRAPDSVLVTSLHLLSLALDISEVQIQCGGMANPIPLLGYAGEEISTGFNDGHEHQSLLSLLVLLMRKTEKENVYSFDISSLIKILLRKFAELDAGCLKKLQILAPEFDTLLSNSKPSSDTSNSASISDSDKQKAKSRKRQAAIMEKMKAQQAKFMENINLTAESGLNNSSLAEETVSDVANDPDGQEQQICSLCHDANSNSPVSFLIFLQKSKVASLLDKGSPSWEKEVQRSGKEKVSVIDDTFNNQSSSRVETITSSQLMDLVQNAVTEFASTDLPHELDAFLDFIKIKFPSLQNVHFPQSSHDNTNQTATSLGDAFEESMYTDMLRILDNDLMKGKDLSSAGCHSSSDSSSNESLLLGIYIASLFNEIMNNPSPSETGGSHSNTTPSLVTLDMTYDGFESSDCNGIYVSSCGHAVHHGCLDHYLRSLKERNSRRTDLEGGQSVDLNQEEFLCPVCRGLANSVLPDLPKEETKNGWQSKSQNLLSTDASDVSFLGRSLSLLQAAADVSRSNEVLKDFPVQHKRETDTTLESVVRLLREMYFSGNDKDSRSNRLSDSMIIWDTLKYSIISTEIAARSERTSSATNLSTGALYEELRSSSGFILSLLLKIAHKTRVQSSLDLLLRLRCIQQFAKSICCADTLNDPSNDTYRVGGSMMTMLGNTDTGIRFPDLQFLAMASSPILASDAFSTLMWILFCLPVPFMSSEKTFFPLVHMCYVVSIAQAAITFIGRNESIHEFSHHDSLFTDIFKFVGEHRFLNQYFVSNYIDNSGDINASIRRLSFPFLRRCAILWKLMNSSTSSPFSGVLKSSKRFKDRMDYSYGTLEETTEIEELEKLFKIPPLDNIVNDEMSRSLVKKWLQHIAKDLEVGNRSRVLHLTPVVPFKLMILPYLYEDLLHRYMKRKCVDCGAVLDEPALCLLCGKLCSPSWKTCCRDGKCQTHAMSCGAGTGVFLLIRKTLILLQRSAGHAFWPSPYLDAFGEEDVNIERGKPLYLNEERYAALGHMVTSHGIARSSKALHQTLIGAFLML